VTARNREGILKIQAGAVVLAMGCRERSRGALNISGTRPAGVYSAGTAQKLINCEGYMVGKRVVILGSGDIGLIMARRMSFEGAKVEAVCEIMPYSGGLTRNIVQCLEDYDIPLYLSTTVAEIHGKKRVEGVTIAEVDENRRVKEETKRYIPCDTLLLSCGLIPENELTRSAGIPIDPITSGALVDENRQTATPGIFACGNVLQVHDLVDYVTEESFTAGEGTVLTFANDIPAEVVGAEGFKLLRVNQNNATNLNFVITSNTDGSTTTIGVNYANAPYEYVVVPEATEVVGAISGILANITTGNGFWVNFYIPTSLGLEADATYNGTTMIGGVEYAVYTVKGISPTSTAKAALPIKVATVGETVYYRNATISIPDYFTAVLADAEVTEAEKALVANAANYCNELYKTVKPAGYSVYNTIVTDYADYLITAPEFESVGTVTSTDVVSQAQIIIAPGNVPMFAFTKVADATVTIGYTDIYGEAATADCTVMTHGEVEYYVVAEMHAYDMIGTITVYVNGTEALTYSLGDYINSLDPEADATTISIAKALYSYAKAVINFKKS